MIQSFRKLNEHPIFLTIHIVGSGKTALALGIASELGKKVSEHYRNT